MAAATAAHATIDLGTLLKQFQLGLVLITGGSGTAELPVQWVHSSDIADPTPFLTPRTVLLTTGTQFDDGASAAEVDAYVARLVRAGVTALGFGVDVRWELIPQTLISAAERLALPLFRVPYQTPFLAIAQAATRLLNAQTHARDTWALESQRAVASAATQRDGLTAVIREAANRLGSWIAVVDRSGRITEFSPHSLRTSVGADIGEGTRREIQDLMRRGTRSSRVRSIGGHEVELQTLGRSGKLLGALVTPAGAGDHAERMLLGLVAALATVQLEHRAGRRTADASLRAAILNLLLSEEFDLASRIAEHVLPRLPRGRIAVVRLREVGALAEELSVWLSSIANAAPGLLTAPVDGGEVIVCEGAKLASVRRILIDSRIVAGISERGEVDQLPRLLEQAETALEHGEAAHLTEPIDYRPDMHGGVLRLLESQPDARRLAGGLLDPLRKHDRRHSDQIERSLTTWLSHHGQTSAAAAALGVHRHTLRARMQTAASLLHRDLEDADTRAELWAALRLSPSEM